MLDASEAGVTLSARVAVAPPGPSAPPSRGLLLLHAWPRLGGSSNDPIITALYHAARKSAAFTVVVRCDQRGVGKSGGSRGVWGFSDAADAADLAARLRAGTCAPGIPAVDRLYVAGYSWGAVLGALSTLPLAAGWVGVSPPLGGAAGLALRTGRAAAALGMHPDVPGLVIMGDRDQFASVRGVERVVAGVNEARQVGREAGGMCGLPPAQRVKLRVVEGADHFWGATAWCPSWGEVADVVLAWISGVEAQRGEGSGGGGGGGGGGDRGGRDGSEGSDGEGRPSHS